MIININTLHLALANVPESADSAFSVSVPCTNVNSELQVSDFRFDYLCLIHWFTQVKKQKVNKAVRRSTRLRGSLTP